ncbi:hypothetical protein BRC67_00700 [Halobacteriales archaeon QH_3_68_24]|nr:MAG: hypothetical protein BRC67_00700 [Halobacteriales archaeon QH_3_68_24]
MVAVEHADNESAGPESAVVIVRLCAKARSLGVGKPDEVGVGLRVPRIDPVHLLYTWTWLRCMS